MMRIELDYNPHYLTPEQAACLIQILTNFNCLNPIQKKRIAPQVVENIKENFPVKANFVPNLTLVR